MEKINTFTFGLTRYRIVRYLTSGGSAAAVNVITLFILVQVFGLYYLFSSVISFIAGLVVSFLMQKYFTFNDYSRHIIKKQIIFYAALHTLNLCLNTLLMYVGVDLLKIHYIIAQVVIIGFLAMCNFFTSKHLVFIPDGVYNKNN